MHENRHCLMQVVICACNIIQCYGFFVYIFIFLSYFSEEDFDNKFFRTSGIAYPLSPIVASNTIHILLLL